MSSKDPLEEFAAFVQKNIILIEGGEYYTIQKDEKLNNAKPKKIKYNQKEKSDGLYYFHAVHIMIIIYYENENVKKSVTEYIKDENRPKKLSNIDESKIKLELDYFLLGNLDWILKKIKKKPKDFDAIKPEEDRLIIMAILMIYNGYSTKISKNIPIIAHDGYDLLDTVQIFRGVTKDNKYFIGSSKKFNYKFPGLIFNAMNYKMKTSKYVLDNININELEKKLKEQVKKTRKKIMMTIDSVSLSENPSSVYYMIQLISDLFSDDDILEVTKELKIKT